MRGATLFPGVSPKDNITRGLPVTRSSPVIVRVSLIGGMYSGHTLYGQTKILHLPSSFASGDVALFAASLTELSKIVRVLHN